MGRLSKIDKYKKAIGATTLTDEDCIYIKNKFSDTGNYVLNAMLSGNLSKGVPFGDTIMFSGDPSTGKSYLLTMIAVTFLKNDPEGIVYYLETEGTIARNLISEDVADRFLIIPIESVEKMKFSVADIVTLVEEEQLQGKVMLFMDSIGNIASEKEIRDTFNKNDKQDMTKQKTLKSFFRIYLNIFNRLKIPFIVSNHTYDSIGGFMAEKVHSGGKGSTYAGSSIFSLSKSKEKKSGKQIGVVVKISINKNDKSRWIVPTIKGQIVINFKTGIKRYSGIIPFLESLDIITKKGKTYKYEEIEGTKRVFARKLQEYFSDKNNLDKLDKLVHDKIALDSKIIIENDEEDEEDE